MKLHTGDTVIVISGKDKGKTGSIARVLPKEGRVVVNGINMRTRHIKKTYQQAGRILKYEASINVSKVMLLDPKSKKASRVGYTMDKDGNKKRISKLSGEAVTKVRAKKTVKKETAALETSADTPKKKTATKADKEEKVTPDAGGKKQPFWKRMQFGSNAMDEAEVTEGSHSKQDHTIPEQQIPRKSAGRGS